MKDLMCEFERSIFHILVENRELQISAISEISGMSVPTITKYMSTLLEKQLVRQVGKTNNERGRQATLYAVNEKLAYFIGVDPKQVAITIAMMDLSGNIIREKKVPYEFSNTPETLEKICQNIDLFIEESGVKRDRIKCVSINFTGRVNPETGHSYSMFHFEGNDEPLADVLGERLGIHTQIDNNTRAMALGELKTAIGERFRNFLFINASWGIGMTIIFDGKIYYGKNGYCGELGHSNVFNNDKICHCGKKGCLETEVSGKAICEQIRKRIENGETSRLGKAEHISIYDVLDAADKEDPLSIELLERAGALLGKQVANLINIFNPEAVVIGGSLATAGDYFLQPLAQSVRRYTLKLVYKDTTIVPSELGERAGVVGACLEAREKYISSVSEVS